MVSVGSKARFQAGVAREFDLLKAVPLAPMALLPPPLACGFPAHFLDLCVRACRAPGQSTDWDEGWGKREG